MPLIPILQKSPEQVYKLAIQQVVSLCGNGKLTDTSECSQELRDFFSQAPSEKLFAYLDTCLSEGFEKSGNVLQDVVNELGRRLDFDVMNGQYAGRSNAIGFDGIWTGSEGHAIVVEVKTSDAYRINLDTIAAYRTKLIETKQIGPNSSILIVVGRQDTGDLEAQVRGSRHAWDIRLISADALVKLVKLKEEAEEGTVVKIKEMLIPFEYTRVDKIIDLAFTAAREVGDAVEKESPTAAESDDETLERPLKQAGQQHTSRNLINELRYRIIVALGLREKRALIRKSAALYWSTDPNHQLRVACTISKRYRATYRYWYAYHPPWDEFLAAGNSGYFVLGCVDKDVAFALPHKWIHEKLPGLHVTHRDDGDYWHVHLFESADGEVAMNSPLNGKKFPLTEFAVPL